jgi:hypothetical protein
MGSILSFSLRIFLLRAQRSLTSLFQLYPLPELFVFASSLATFCVPFQSLLWQAMFFYLTNMFATCQLFAAYFPYFEARSSGKK